MSLKMQFEMPKYEVQGVDHFFVTKPKVFGFATAEASAACLENMKVCLRRSKKANGDVSCCDPLQSHF